MSLSYIRKVYGVPAKRGGRVRYTGGIHPSEGRILGADGPHLRIRMDGSLTVLKYHPTWKIEYLTE